MHKKKKCNRHRHHHHHHSHLTTASSPPSTNLNNAYHPKNPISISTTITITPFHSPLLSVSSPTHRLRQLSTACDFITSFSPIATNANSPQQQHPLPLAHNNNNANVEELMGLLGISVPTKHDGTTCSYSSCGEGFCREVVGVKGTRCRKEMERLDEWVNVFFKEKRETVRLVHLMIGKVVAVSHAAESESESESGGGFEGIEFPATVKEFLERDPPLMTEMEGGE